MHQDSTRASQEANAFVGAAADHAGGFATPPAAQTSQAPIGTFYRVDSSRARFRELWRDARSPLVAIVWITKLFRVKLPGSVNDANVEELDSFEVDPNTIPADAFQRLMPAVGQLQSQGFQPVAWYSVVDLFHSSRLHFALLAHTSGTAIARVLYRSEGTGNPPKRHFHTDFLSELADGRMVWSTSARAYLDPPPGCVLNPQVGMDPALLWSNHRQRLDLMRVDAGAKVVPLPPASGQEQDDRGARDLLERHHALVRDDRLRRRIFAPMTRHELERAAAVDQFRTAADAGQLRHPDVLAEIDKLQNKRAGWAGTLLLLVVSAALFIGAGTRDMFRDREFLAIILTILLVHELGHYVTMRLFRYRNLRMFFIPMFGAAVSGHHYNVPGWKKVIVALAGPLPGIVGGIALGIYAMVKGHNPLLLKAAVAAIAINGFNLLPILPLDGGRVVHALLFARHPILDVAFRAVAGGLLILASLAGGKFLAFLGILTLVSIAVAYRIARIARDLRLAGLYSVSPDSQTIPADVAQFITDHVKAAFPVKVGNKAIAQHVLNVYETLNAKPPGWLATFGFGTLHGAAFVLSIVASIVFIVAQQPGGLSRQSFAALAARAAAVPTIPLEPSAVRVAGVSPSSGPAGLEPAEPERYVPDELDGAKGTKPRRRVVVAHFDKLSPAETAFDEAAKQLPSGGGIVLLGQTVMLSLPAEGGDDVRRQWMDFMDARTKHVFLEHRESPAVQLQFKVDSETSAKRLDQELGGYFRSASGGEKIVAPWDPEDARTPDERAKHSRARQTYLRLEKLNQDIYDEKAEPRLATISKSMRTASRRGETAELKKLRDEQQKIVADRRKHAMDIVRADPTADPAVVDLFAEHTAMTEADPDIDIDEGSSYYNPAKYEAYQRKLAAHFGPLPVKAPATRPTRAAARFSANGHVARQGSTLTVNYLTFTDAIDGPPTFLKWLSAQGARDFKYSLEHLRFEKLSEAAGDGSGGNE